MSTKKRNSKKEVKSNNENVKNLNMSQHVKPTKMNREVENFMKNIGKLSFAPDFNSFGLIPKLLGVNRPVNSDHVSTLSTIISNGNNLWHPIFVIENKFKVKKGYFQESKMNSLRLNSDGSYSVIDDEDNIPNFIIIDGQHRFHAFKNTNTSFPFYDVTNVLNIEYLDEVIDIVNNFNIGVNGYTQSMIRDKNLETSPYLKYFDDITKNIMIDQQADKNIRKTGEKHVKRHITIPLNDRKSPYKISFVNKGSIGLIKKEVDRHVKNKYMSTEPLSKELKDYMDDLVLVFQMINRLTDGYTPYQTTIYQFLIYIKNQIVYKNIDFKDFLIKFENHLTGERDAYLNSNNYNLDDRDQLRNLVENLFGHNQLPLQVLRMLKSNNLSYKHDKINNSFEI